MTKLKIPVVVKQRSPKEVCTMEVVLLIALCHTYTHVYAVPDKCLCTRGPRPTALSSQPQPSMGSLSTGMSRCAIPYLSQSLIRYNYS